MKIEEKLVAILKEKKLTIASVESLTAGLFSSFIANVSGASSVLKGAFVTYQSNFKTSLLNIKKETIDKYGVVSSKIAKEMVNKSYPFFKTDIIVSFTGNAGPSAEKGYAPVGRVYIGFLFNGQECYILKKDYKGTRNSIRLQAVKDALYFVFNKLSGPKIKEINKKK